MQERGTWHGNRPTHSVPAQEEGEPPAQRPRTSTLQLRQGEESSPSQGGSDSPIAGFTSSDSSPSSSSSSADTPDSLPPLESSPTDSGKQWLIMGSQF